MAVLFLLSLSLTPLFTAVPATATAPALIVVGVSHGIVSYVLIKALRGRFRDVHPLMYVLAGLLIVFCAVRTGG